MYILPRHIALALRFAFQVAVALQVRKKENQQDDLVALSGDRTATDCWLHYGSHSGHMYACMHANISGMNVAKLCVYGCVYIYLCVCVYGSKCIRFAS